MTTSADTVTSLDELVAADGVEYEYVSLPGGKRLRLGSVSGEVIVEWTELRDVQETRRLASSWLIAKSVVGEDGVRIGVTSSYSEMTEADKARVLQVRKLSSKVTETVLKAVFTLNGIMVNAKAEAVAKNG